MRRTFTAAAAAAAFALGATAPAVAGPPERTTIVDAAVANGGFTQLVAAVTELGLADTLDGNRQFTVFAPTDQAFFDLYDSIDGVKNLDDLIGLLGEDAVRDVVLYHVAPGERLSGDVVSSTQINTLTKGEKIPVSFDGEDVILDEATLLTPDVDVDNGVIHVIDAVMLPSFIG